MLLHIGTQKLRGTTQIIFQSGISLKGSNVATVIGYTAHRLHPHRLRATFNRHPYGLTPSVHSLKRAHDLLLSVIAFLYYNVF